MQLHDILLLRASAILPEAISHKSPISIVENNKQWIGACGLDNIRKSAVPSDILWNNYFVMNKQ